MQFTVKSAMAVLAFCAGLAKADQCAKGSELSEGNSYCQPVKELVYSGVGGSGSYNKVTSMTGGACSQEATAYSGPVAPFDEEVSLHFRGPMHLKKVAAYTKSGSSAKRSAAGGPHSRRHAGHAKFHEKKEAGPVTATIDGKVVTWENNYFGPGGSAPTSTPVAADPAKVATPIAANPSAKAATPVKAKAASSSSSSSSGAYSRVGYYDASSGSADGITFLGNYGGSGSGVFDSNYGNSLSYLNSDGNGGSSSPSVLSDKLIASNEEFTIMTDKECSGDDCGYVRPGTVAYHGFDGGDKIFMFEFDMPHDNSDGFNADMPASGC